MSENIQLIRPGYLVSLRTGVAGGVSYKTSNETIKEEGKEEIKTWKTERHVIDKEELKRATDARDKIGNLIRNVCIRTPFGILCPTDNEAELDKKIKEAQKIADTFNKSAKHSQVNVFVLRGRIADNDREAARAIISDVKAAFDEMQQAMKDADVKGLRSAAQRAKQLSRMLDAKQGEKIGAAVKAARTAARAIVKRVEKGDELAEKVLKEINLKPINSLRFAGLGMDDDSGVPMVMVEETPEKATKKKRRVIVEEPPEEPVEAPKLAESQRKKARKRQLDTLAEDEAIIDRIVGVQKRVATEVETWDMKQCRTFLKSHGLGMATGSLPELRDMCYTIRQQIESKPEDMTPMRPRRKKSKEEAA